MRALAVLAALVAVLVAGCGSSSSSGGGAGDETTTFAVWFAKGETLARTEVSAPKTEDGAGGSVEALLAGPADAGLGTEIPPATQLRGVRVADGVATVDLTRAFESGGGSLSMRMRVAQVVYTLTEIDGVDAVRFELDGAPVEAIGGEGVMVAEPVGRAGFSDLAG